MTTTLLDLPVLPRDRDSAYETDVIRTAYVKERKAIKSVEDLAAFIKRWEALWKLRDGNMQDYPVPVATEAVWTAMCSPTLGEGGINTPDEHAAANILIPPPLLLADVMSMRYGIGTDLGMVRVFLDPYPEHLDRLRGEFIPEKMPA